MDTLQHGMTVVDWGVLAILLFAIIGGLAQGFFRSAFGLGGLIAGLVLGAWNYQKLAALMLPLVHVPAVVDTIAFLLIAIVVMALFALVGNLLAKAFRLLGLGCLDTLAGGVFGFFQGALVVVITLIVIVAFFPQVRWVADARIPRMFFGACHLSASLTPDDLAQKVRTGIEHWESESPRWLHPGSGSL